MAFLLAPGQLNIENFDRNTDPIAIVLKSFTLNRRSEGLFGGRRAEPYVVSLSIDESGAADPHIDFSVLPFPNVLKGDTINFDGQGHLIYGPKNPGSFVTYSILFMESDSDIRNLGELVQTIVSSQAADLGAKALLAAVPTAGTAITILTELIKLLAGELRKNKDDELFRREGTFFRGLNPPFDILRTFKAESDFINYEVSILPLVKSNQLGAQTNTLPL